MGIPKLWQPLSQDDRLLVPYGARLQSLQFKHLYHYINTLRIPNLKELWELTLKYYVSSHTYNPFQLW